MAALVLSGGGPLAVAWEAGFLAGLRRQGVSLADADFVLGTSAGAIVGAQLCNGADPIALADAIRAEAHGVPPRGSPPPFDPEAAARLPALFMKAQNPAADAAAARAEVGAYALSARTEDEQTSISRFAAMVGDAWPHREFGCVVVDAEDGRVVLLTRRSGAPLSAAVAASCSLPGLNPPVTIEGRRYIDGGFASAANSDLATGHEKILVLAFLRPGPSASRVTAITEGQAARLREKGSAVLTLYPNEANLAIIGADGMNVAARPRVAEAAMAQGAAEASAVAAFWT